MTKPERDYSETLFLPQTDFPMRAGLPQKEPEILARWEKDDLYGQLRAASKGREKFVLHDGPPYANGNIHIGHALNKILKDVVTRSQQMLGYDSNYVPGWDCHGLPIEWKIEEENYRSKNKKKPDLSDPAAMVAFRQECRAYAQGWLEVQRTEFKRLGVEGDWAHPYTTMDFFAEAQIARELMKFAANKLLYRGSKPVMWSVVEKTALAEAEIEYEDYTSDTVWVKFPVLNHKEFKQGARLNARLDFPIMAQFQADMMSASVLIWTTTPWTIPGNRAISYSDKIEYVLVEVDGPIPSNRQLPIKAEDLTPEEVEAAKVSGASLAAYADGATKEAYYKQKNVFLGQGERLILAKELLNAVMHIARAENVKILRSVSADELSGLTCAHPLREMGYDFDVPLLKGDHVTAETGTGFVHTAPGHGREDFEVWTSNMRALEARGISTVIPYTVDENGALTSHAPGFEGKRVINDNGEKGNANQAVIEALRAAKMFFAKGTLRHQYPHSWRSKKPVIFRNTPQWFIAMDKPGFGPVFAKRNPYYPLEVDRTRSFKFRELPKIPNRQPRWKGPRILSRIRLLRLWVKAFLKSGETSGVYTLRQIALQQIAHTRWVPLQGENRITGMVGTKPDWVISRQRAWGVPIAVFIKEKPDGSVEILDDPGVNLRIVEAFEKEGADAWYKEGARERFLGKLGNDAWKKVDDICDVWFDSGSTHAFVLEDPVHFPQLAGIKRKIDGGKDTVMYLEGSDQHRGWFQSSLLESCGTRGQAPFDVVLTHGFVLDEHGRAMSKSAGNGTAPQDVIKNSGADILRMWVCASDYADDLRIGPEILKTTADTYRKLRNTLRWMLGSLAHFHDDERVKHDAMPELERLMLHRLSELDVIVRQAYADFDYKRIFAMLSAFMTSDLSAFYFDVRKDVLYCDPISSMKRKACLTVVDQLFRATVVWLAPMLCFTVEETWMSRYGADAKSVHLETFPELPAAWRDDRLAEKWRKVRTVRRVVTGALEIARAQKRIGSSLEAHPVVHIADEDLFEAVVDIDLAEICITSAATLVKGDGPGEAFRLPDVTGVAVVTNFAEGTKCARSWKILTDIGADPEYPDVSPRDAKALREWETMRKAAE